MKPISPIDPDYLARREKQIKDAYLLRALARTFAICAVVGLGAALLIFPEIPDLAIVIGLFALATGLTSLIMWSFQSANAAAEIAIQKERDALIALYGSEPEKVKRTPPVPLSEEGELLDLDPASGEHDRIESMKAPSEPRAERQPRRR
jgi:hypothetical protein